MLRRAILGAGAVALTLLGVVCIVRHLPTSTASSLVPATLHARLEHRILTLRGSLPDEISKIVIVQRARELYGSASDRVVDELVVDPRVGPASWADNVVKTLPVLGRMTEHGSIMIDGRTIVISGRVDNDRAKAALLQEVVPLTQAGLNLEDHILTGPSAASSSSTLQKKLDEILSRGSIEFDSNATTMTPRSRTTLDQLMTQLRHAPHTAIEIGGHTDKYGAPDYNLELSRRRAEAVREYFVSHGLTNQFTAIGYGASRPLSVAQTRTGLQHDRRIELRVKGVNDQ